MAENPHNNLPEQYASRSDHQELSDYFGDEQSLIDSITDPTLQEVAKQEFEELLADYTTEKDKICGDMSCMLDLLKSDVETEFRRDIEGMRVIETYKDMEGYAEFVNTLKISDESTQEKIYSIFLNTPEENIKEFIELELDDNLGNFNEETLGEFNIYFAQNIEQETISEFLEKESLSTEEIAYRQKRFEGIVDLLPLETQEKVELKLQENKKANNEQREQSNEQRKELISERSTSLNNILSRFQDKPGFESFVSHIEEFNKIEYEGLDDLSQVESKLHEKIKYYEDVILPYLNKKNIGQLLQSAKESSPEDFRFLYDTLFSSLGEGVRQVVKLYDSNPETFDIDNPPISDHNKFRLRNAFDGPPDIDGKFLKRGDKIIDMSEKPPRADLVSSNGFKLETSLSYRGYYQQRAEFEAKSNELRQEIHGIDAEIGSIDEVLEDEKKLEELLKGKNPGVEITGENREELIQELKEELNKRKEDLMEQKQEKQAELKNLESDFTRKYKENIQENDKEVREIMRFVESIGFNQIPQQFTNLIIAEINMTSLRGVIELGGGCSIEEDIDIAKGKLGMSTERHGPQKTKEGFVRLFNKMLTGNPEDPVNIQAFAKGLDSMEDPQEMRSKMMMSGVLTQSGGVNLNLIRQNLKSPINNEIKTQTGDGVKTENGERWTTKYREKPKAEQSKVSEATREGAKAFGVDL